MMAEKIELVLVKRKLSKVQLAKLLHTSSSNIYNKFRRDNFSEKDMQQIADVLNCTLDLSLTLNDTGEKF
jgi:hypothetical protein